MSELSVATLGGGCFWCVEAIMEQIEGVHHVMSGYSGGTKEDADYKKVCAGITGHVEVVQVHFDAAIVTYKELLEIFITTHDPTTPNRQGNDVGPQYRSVIFYHSAEQRKDAEMIIMDYAPQVWDDPVVTELIAFDVFFPAEEYHHGYYQKVGQRNPYCTFVITPKVNKFRKLFSHKLKQEA